MNGNKKVILHIAFDGILFDQVYPRFEEMDRYENIYLLLCNESNPEIKYIRHTEKLICAYSIEAWGKVINDPKVDIIYLHGLWYLQVIDYIRPRVIVMWWCYGKEIYENCYGLPPLMSLQIYKPKTFKFIQSLGGIGFKFLNYLLYYHPKLYILYITTRRKAFSSTLENRAKLKEMLSRVDYAFTPLQTELIELKKARPYIRAKPFILRGVIEKVSINIHKTPGNILLEHSAHFSNNHLDILAVLKEKKVHMQGRNIFIPLSYGETRLAERVKEEAKFDGASVHCLMEALAFAEYKEMLDGCTHAIFGMIRQSGLGNIYLCFRKGVKVFLFKDSVLYKQFKADGYYVFSIEDDLNDISIQEPLTEDQALNNYNIFYSQMHDLGTYQEQMDRILNDYKNDEH